MIPSSTAGTGSFDFAAVLSDAWPRVKGTKGVLFLMLLFIGALQFAVLGFLTAAAAGALLDQPLDGPYAPFGFSGFLGYAALLVIGSAFYPGLVAVGLNRAAGKPVRFGMLFGYTRHFWSFLVVSGVGAGASVLAQAVLPPLAYYVLWLSTLFFFIFTGVFIVDREQGPFEALASSARLAVRNAGQMVLYLLFFALLVLGSALTLGIGALWAMPLTLILGSCAYRDAVGIVSETEPWEE